MTELSTFLKKVAKSFVNRNGNVVPLQRQKGRRSPPPAPPRGGEMEKVEFESRKLKIGCARRLTLEI